MRTVSSMLRITRSSPAIDNRGRSIADHARLAMNPIRATSHHGTVSRPAVAVEHRRRGDHEADDERHHAEHAPVRGAEALDVR